MNREIKMGLKTLLEAMLKDLRNNEHCIAQYAYSYVDIMNYAKKEWYTFKSGYTSKRFNDYGGRALPYVGRHGYGYIILTNELELTTQYSRARYVIIAESLSELMSIVWKYKNDHRMTYELMIHGYVNRIEEIVKQHGIEVRW